MYVVLACVLQCNVLCVSVSGCRHPANTIKNDVVRMVCEKNDPVCQGMTGNSEFTGVKKNLLLVFYSTGDVKPACTSRRTHVRLKTN